MAKEVKEEVKEVEPVAVEPVMPEAHEETPEEFKIRKSAELAAVPVLDINSPAQANMTYEQLKNL